MSELTINDALISTLSAYSHPVVISSLVGHNDLARLSTLYTSALLQSPENKALAMQLLRNKRNDLLSACDVKVLPDYPHKTAAQRSEWNKYRQKLRDLPSKSHPVLMADGLLNMASVYWPKKPS